MVEVSETQPAPPERTLRQRVIVGSAWTLTSFGLAQVLRFGSNIALARLLSPEIFGLMALVNLFLRGTQMLSDVGIGPSVTQSPRGESPAFLATAWTIQVTRGVLLALMCLALARPMAWFYDQPLLAPLIGVSALTVLLPGLNSTSLYVLGRHMEMRALSVLEIGTQILSIAAMIAWARLAPSAWALVGGAVIGSLIKLVASHLFLRGGVDRLRWDPRSARELIAYGKWIFVSTLLTFFAAELDRLVFGKMIPIAELGVYSIATMISGMPVQAILAVGSSIAFPAYSRIHREGGDIGRAFDRLRRPLVVLGGAMLSALVACGDLVITILYDARYAGAGWILRVLAIAGWFLVLECTNGALLLARNAPDQVALGNAGKIVGLVVGMPVGYRRLGFPGAVGGVVVAEAMKYAVSAWSLARHHVSAWRRDLAFTAVFGGAVGVGVVVRAALERAHLSVWGVLPAAAAATVAVWGPLLWGVAKELRRDAA